MILKVDFKQNIESKNYHVERSKTPNTLESRIDFLSTAQNDKISESKQNLKSHTTQNLESKSNHHKIRLAKQDACRIEKNFAYPIMANGARRYAWVYPSDLSIKYNAEKAQVEIAFTLPSGAYATSFLSYIKNGDVREF